MNSYLKHYKLKYRRYRLLKHWKLVQTMDSQKWTFALDSPRHQIDITTLIEGFGGFCQLIYALSESISDNAEITIKVDAIKPGSFEIGIELWRIAPVILGTIISNDTGCFNIQSLVDLLKKFLNISLFLAGKKPDKIENIGDGTVNIISGNNNMIISTDVLKMYSGNNKASNFIRQSALSMRRDEFVNGFSIYNATNNEQIFQANQEGLARLSAPNDYFEKEEKETFDNQAELVIRGPRLDGTGSWLCLYRKEKIRVKFEDPSFLKKVKSGEELFANKDILRVKLKILSVREPGESYWKEKSYAVVEVLEHKKSSDYGKNQGLIFDE